MNRATPINIIRFVLLLLIQVLILNQIELHGFISPFIYPLAILLLPIDTPRWLLLCLAFALGMGVDTFTNTPGLHASATVFLAFSRNFILKVNEPPGGYEPGQYPNISSMGLNWFIVYAGIGILVHHLFYFSVEAFSFSYWYITLTKIVISSAISIVLMILTHYLFPSKV